MSAAMPDLPSILENESPEKSLEQILSEYNTPEFTEAILEHFLKAKRCALADVRGTGITNALSHIQTEG